MWFDVRAYPWRGGLAIYFLDITQRKAAQAEAARQTALLRAIVQTTDDLIYVKDRDSRMLLANPSCLETIGLPEAEVLGRNELEWGGDTEQYRRILENDRRIMDSGRTEQVEEAFEGPRGARVYRSTKTPMIDDAGDVVGLVGITTDITEINRAQRHKQLLIDELNHRVKNTLSIVQSIARRSFKASGVPDHLQSAFQGRIAALAATHDILTRETWEKVDLEELLANAMDACGIDPGRVNLRGPSIILMPKQAVTMTMAVHELCTNALKYGALSNETGRVEVGWDIAGHEPARLHLEWRESGGPEVAPPPRRGFGSMMIEGALAIELGGAVTIAFEPGGVRCAIDAPCPDYRPI
jgi:PAS domain S-box-containing protein